MAPRGYPYFISYKLHTHKIICKGMQISANVLTFSRLFHNYELQIDCLNQNLKKKKKSNSF